MKRIMYLICFLLGIGLTCVSCQDDYDKPVHDKGNRVRIAFETPDFVQLGTRAMSESSIADVTVLQYKEGKLAKKIFLEGRLFIQAVQAVEITGLESIPASILDNKGALERNNQENVIVFLVNIEAVTGAPVSLAEDSPYADLMAYSFNLADEAALASLLYMPMTGLYYGGITEGLTNQINVTLRRALAKVNFTVNTDNFMADGEKSRVTVNSISLHNIPLTLELFPVNRPGLPVNNLPGEWPMVQIPYPVAENEDNETAAADGGIDASNFATLEITDSQVGGNKVNTFVAYMPENARGSYSNITNNKQKIPANISEPANRVGLTYILVDLDYENSAGVARNATYKIYLGGDDSGDMNLLSSTQYNVTTYIYGDGSNASNTDTRITVTPIFDPSVTNAGTNSVQDLANCYMINTAAVPTNFTIPLLQARSGWRYIHTTRKSVGDETDYTAAIDSVIANEWRIETLWKTWNDGKNITGTVAGNGLVTAMGDEGNKYYATLDIPPGIPNGNNCVIALMDAESKIWWSWHLWLTDYNPNAPQGSMKGQTHQYFSEAFTPAGLYYNKRMMDRNLGATITGITDDYIQSQPQTTALAVKWYGLLYQWGGKNPITSMADGTATAVPVYDTLNRKYSYANNVTVGKDMNGYTLVTVQNNTNNPSLDGFPKIDNKKLAVYRVIDVTRNPMHVFTNSLNSDWTAQDNALWYGITKTPFDPCPARWRIPSGASSSADTPFAGFADGNYRSTGSADPYASIWGRSDVGPFPSFTDIQGEPGTRGRLYGSTDAIDKELGTFTGDPEWYGSVKGINNSVAWFPESGSQDNPHLTSRRLNQGYYWLASPSYLNGMFMLLADDNVRPRTGWSRQMMCFVRCIQE